ncbi:hypothetical protein [Sporosarcina sp. FSL K6-2383]|uniref:hypothetical protein n=1 Tax=Sporosarcina sp. FSL K6-2383 TaxID=2921556 RepID=UPI00315A94C0
MSTRKVKLIRSSLEKKGFSLKETHHFMYTLYVDGKKTSIRTRLSHGLKEYDDHLLGQMSKQLAVTKEELLDLIDCPMSYESYVELLRNKQAIK